MFLVSWYLNDDTDIFRRFHVMLDSKNARPARNLVEQ